MDYSKVPPPELVLACLRNEEAAWSEFVRRFHPVIASVVVRVARQWGNATPQNIDDLVQETYLKLCATGLRSFKNLDSNNPDAVYGYVKVFAANLTHDHMKAANAQRRGGAEQIASLGDELQEAAPEKTDRPEAILERRLLLQKVAACLYKVTTGANTERDRRIFWLYYRVGLSASAIATLPTINLGTKGVESTILRVTRLVRQQLTGQKERRDDSGTGKGIITQESL